MINSNQTKSEVINDILEITKYPKKDLAKRIVNGLDIKPLDMISDFLISDKISASNYNEAIKALNKIFNSSSKEIRIRIYYDNKIFSIYYIRAYI